MDKAVENYNLSIKNNFYGNGGYEVYFSLGVCYYFKYKMNKQTEDYFNISLSYYKQALNISPKKIKIHRFIRYLYIVRKIIPPSS